MSDVFPIADESQNPFIFNIPEVDEALELVSKERALAVEVINENPINTILLTTHGVIPVDNQDDLPPRVKYAARKRMDDPILIPDVMGESSIDAARALISVWRERGINGFDPRIFLASKFPPVIGAANLDSIYGVYMTFSNVGANVTWESISDRTHKAMFLRDELEYLVNQMEATGNTNGLVIADIYQAPILRTYIHIFGLDKKVKVVSLEALLWEIDPDVFEMDLNIEFDTFLNIYSRCRNNLRETVRRLQGINFVAELIRKKQIKNA
jgi:hypothetical protein